MAKRGGQDFDGKALAGFERTLRNEPKDNRTQEEIAADNKLKRENAERKRKELEREKNERVTFTGIPDRELYLKNKEIIKQKELGTFEKEKKVKEPKEKKTKAPVDPVEVYDNSEVELVSVHYGIKDVALVDVTGKVALGDIVNNKTAGDPVKGKVKRIYIKALVNGVELERELREGRNLVVAK